MNMLLHIYKYVCVLVIFFLIGRVVLAQADEKVPLRADVCYGKLTNGFQYYILKNDDASGRVAMKMIVNAGKFDVDSDQVGLPHLVEHVAMRSTTHFKQGVKSFLFSKGLRKGSDVNASTEPEMTEYEINIPDNNFEMLDLGILALSDCAGRVSFLPNEIDEERSAVLREAATGNDPFSDALSHFTYWLMDNKELYADVRLRDMENVSKASNESIIRFYNDWYHPMYQTLFVVGDIDIIATEARIKQHFSSLNNIGVKLKRKDISKMGEVLLQEKNRFIIIEHGKSTPTTWIELFKKKKTELTQQIRGTSNEILVSLSDELINEMLRHRLQISREINSAIPEAIGIDRELIYPLSGIDAILTSRSVNNSSAINESIQSALEELYRIKKFGFSEKEFFRAKRIVLSNIEKYKDKNLNHFLIKKLSSYHFQDRVFSLNESELKKKLLEELTVKQINSGVISWLNTEGNLDVVLRVPDKNDPAVPTEAQVFACINKVAKMKLAAFQEPMLKSLPAAPKEVSVSTYLIRELPELNALRLTFENGATVIIKQFANDISQLQSRKVEIRAFNMSALTEINSYRNNIFLPDDLKVFMGVSLINTADLRKIKNEKKVYVSPLIEDGRPQIWGSTNNDIETLMHLVHLYVAKPTVDIGAYHAYCEQVNKNSNQSKISQFQDSIEIVIGKQKIRIKPDSKYCKNNAKELLALYQKNFGNASEFTFIITGVFDKTEMIHLVARYIGTLPGSRKTMRPRETSSSKIAIASKFKPGTQTIMVGDSINNINVRMLFSGQALKNVKDKLALQVVDKALNHLLFTRLREKEKGVYSVRNQLHINEQTNEFFLDVEFETAPADLDRLIAATKDELQLLAEGKLPLDIFSNAVSVIRSEINQNLKNSSYFWNRYLLEREQSGNFASDEVLNQVEILDSLTPEGVCEATLTYLSLNDYMLFKLL